MANEFESIPVPQLDAPEDATSASSDTPPKRRRGRPTNAELAERAARGEKPSKAVSRAPTRSQRKERAPRRVPASLEIRLGAFISQINIFIWALPQTRKDALDPAEVKALASALDQQCRQSPRFRKYIEAMLVAGSGAQLGMVILMIGARRAARHGMVPVEFDDMLGAQIAQMSSMPATPSPVIEVDASSDSQPVEQPTE